MKLIIAVFLLVPSTAFSQDEVQWYDVTQWGIEGRGWGNQERSKWFDRFPAKAEKTGEWYRLWTQPEDATGAWKFSEVGKGYKQATNVQLGDIDGDGSVSGSDLSLVLGGWAP